MKSLYNNYKNMAIVNPNSAGPIATKPEELSLKNKIKQDLTSKGITSLGSFKPTQADVNEFKTTGTFGKSFYNNAKNQTIQQNEGKLFRNEPVNPESAGPLPEIKAPETPTTETTQTNQGIIKPGVIGQKTTETTTPETPATGTPSITTPGETPFPKIQADVLDTNKDFVLGADELTGPEKDVYNMLTDTEKEQFAAIGDMAKKNGQDYAKAQAEYLQKWKANKEYLQGQQDKKTKVNKLTGEIDQIQSSERIQAAQKQLDNLKQTMARLGTMGQPGVSKARLDTISGQLKDAENTFNNLKKVEANYSQIKQLGQEYDTAAFEKQMKDLQDDLDSKVNTAIQDAFNAVSSADMEGKLDSVEEIENIRMQLMANLDTQITGITDANIEQRNFLIERYDKIAQNKLSYIQNKNSINMDMSKVQGFYVDGNGNPVISATTGKTIEIPKSAPLDPVFNKDNGTLITFDYDENGNIVGNVDQVIPKQTFEQSTIANYAKLVADGKIKIDDVPADVRSTSGFVDALVSTPKTTEGKTKYQKIGVDSKGKDIYGFVNEETQTVTPVSGSFAGSTSTGFRDLTTELKRPVGSTNVGQDTNNPGNIMAENEKQREYAKSLGAIGFYKSPNGRTYAVFPDMNSGLNATIQDISTKLSGGSSWVNQNTTLAQLASGWTSGPNAPLNKDAIANYERLTGFSGNTLISKIPQEDLIAAIIQNEGVNINQGSDLSYLGQKETPLSQDIKKLTAFTLADNETNVKNKMLAVESAGYDYEDYLNYKKEMSTLESGKYKDLASVFKSTMPSLGGGMSNEDRAIMMQKYYDGLKQNNPELIKEAIWENIIKDKSKDTGYGYALGEYNKMVGALKMISDNYNDYIKDNGWNVTDKGGLLDGTFEEIYQKLGNTTDPKLAELRTGIDMLLASYKKAISGTAASDSETNFLQGILPSISNNTQLNSAKISGMIKSLNTNINSVLQQPFSTNEQTKRIYNEVVKPRIDIQVSEKKLRGKALTKVLWENLPLTSQTEGMYETGLDISLPSSGGNNEQIDQYYGVGGGEDLFDKYYK